MNASVDLTALAKNVMQEKGLLPEFSPQVFHELLDLEKIPLPLNVTDLRSLVWCSIDNEDSRDLDQLTAYQSLGEKHQVWVAIADVDSLVKRQTAIDEHAQVNTTSVYTPTKVFSMLPEQLSTNLTSLNEGEDRLAIVFKMVLDKEGEFVELESEIMQALVRNQAKLNYQEVGVWLNVSNTIPSKIQAVKDLEYSLKKQHEVAQILRKKRQQHGSLSLETSEVRSKVKNNHEVSLEQTSHNFANQLIEELMILANTAMAKFLTTRKIPSLRRVVKVPKRWNRIVEVAQEFGEKLPLEPDSKALDEFLIKRKKADPSSFQDLSLTIVKLLGRGEYVVEGHESTSGHFGLALLDYTHATAPNRRLPDLITQRQFKSFLRNLPLPYDVSELTFLASHCTHQEDAASKVERQLNKSAAAMFLSSHIGETFEGIVTGSNEKNQWIRLFNPPVEGMLRGNSIKFDVGDRVNVRLIFVDVLKGFIDFELS